MPKTTKAPVDHLRVDCYNSLGQYYLALNPHYKYVDYQQERIIPAIEALFRGDYDRLMLLMPARHSKSDLVTKHSIPWFLGHNPLKNVILLCHTQPLANDFGVHIRDLMANNAMHKRVFPDLRVLATTHAKDFFKTNKGNSFYAFGINAGIPGRGGDLIVIDDPIANIEDALSDLVQHNLYETYKAVIKTRMQAGAKMLMIMTRWGPRDIAARILEEEGSAWKVLAIKAEEDGPDGKPSGHYLWEEHLGRQRYEEAKQDAYLWNAMWQQEPRPRLSAGFQEEWLSFYTSKERPAEYRLNEDGTPGRQYVIPTDYDKLLKFNTYIFVDPALGKSQAHDRTAILVLSAGPEKRLFLVDAVLDRLDPLERIEELIRLCRRWAPETIYYEEYGMTADHVFLQGALEEQELKVNVISIGRKGIKGLNGGRLAKHDRIMQLVADFEANRLWFPKRMVRTLQDGSKFDIMNYFITSEYLPYAGDGSIAHDDMLDCLSRIHDPDVSIAHAMHDTGEDDEYSSYDGGSGSWESRY